MSKTLKTITETKVYDSKFSITRIHNSDTGGVDLRVVSRYDNNGSENERSVTLAGLSQHNLREIAELFAEWMPNSEGLK